MRLIFLILSIIAVEISVSQPLDVNQKLLEASYDGNIDSILWALKNKADVNTSTYEGVTPLMYAVQKGNLEAVKVLIASGANVNALPYNKTSSLIAATKNGNIEIMDYLIQQGADLNQKDKNGFSAIHYACLYSNVVAADMLIYYDAQLNIKTEKGLTPLHLIALKGDTAIARLLINKNVAVDESDNNNTTPLMVAVFFNHIPLAELLLENGADINRADIYGRNSLFLAIAFHRYEFVEKLIKNYKNKEENSVVLKKMAQLSFWNNDRKMYRTLKKNGIKSSLLPFPYTFLVGISEGTFNSDDMLYGGSVGLYDYHYKLSFSVGMLYRFASNRILLASGENNYLQFWEWRNAFYGAIRKNFSFTNRGFEHYGMFATAKFTATNAWYRASKRSLPARYRIVPEVGLFYRFRYVGFDLSYSYFSFDTFNTSPHRINFGINLFIDFKNHLKTTVYIPDDI